MSHHVRVLIEGVVSQQIEGQSHEHHEDEEIDVSDAAFEHLLSIAGPIIEVAE